MIIEAVGVIGFTKQISVSILFPSMMFQVSQSDLFLVLPLHLFIYQRVK